MLEFLEDYDVTVNYDFDRTHENMPDVYWGESKEEGVLLRFDENQVLGTIFLYLESKEEFHPIAYSNIEDIQLFGNGAEVEAYCSTIGAKLKKGRGSVGGGLQTTWARIDGEATSIHYEFVENRLSRVTIMTPDQAP